MPKGFAPVPTPSKRPATAPALDAQDIQSKWLSYFEDLDDPRSAKGTLHPLLSVVMIAILATIGGATGWVRSKVVGGVKVRARSASAYGSATKPSN